MMNNLNLYLQAVLYTITGIIHFVRPSFYEKIMPSWLPFHTLAIYSSGVVEMLLGIGLLFSATRYVASMGLVLMLLVFMLVHVDMLWQAYTGQHYQGYTFWLFVRLLLQFALMYWAFSVRNS